MSTESFASSSVGSYLDSGFDSKNEVSDDGGGGGDGKVIYLNTFAEKFQGGPLWVARLRVIPFDFTIDVINFDKDGEYPAARAFPFDCGGDENRAWYSNRFEARMPPRTPGADTDLLEKVNSGNLNISGEEYFEDIFDFPLLGVYHPPGCGGHRDICYVYEPLTIRLYRVNLQLEDVFNFIFTGFDPEVSLDGDDAVVWMFVFRHDGGVAVWIEATPFFEVVRFNVLIHENFMYIGGGTGIIWTDDRRIAVFQRSVVDFTVIRGSPDFIVNGAAVIIHGVGGK